MNKPLITALLSLSLLAGCKKVPEDGGIADSAEKSAAAAASATAMPTPGDIPAPDDVAAPPADAEKTPSGLASKVLQPGNGGDKPHKWDSVEVNYTGWTTDGKMFDSSVKRGRTAKFPLKGVIPGWTEGLQLMTVGEKRRFWIPTELAYNNAPGKPAGHAGLRRRAHRHPEGARADPRPRRRRGGPGRRQEDRQRPGLQGPHPRPRRRRSPRRVRPRHRALHRLDQRRRDVRQLGAAPAPRHLLRRRASSRAGPKACSS